jgi:hypothetical protein
MMINEQPQEREFSETIALTVWDICEKAKKTVDKEERVSYTLAKFLGCG